MMNERDDNRSSGQDEVWPGVVQWNLGPVSYTHLSSGSESHLIGLLALPTSLYFLWSPITDFLVRRRTWLLAGALSSAVLMAAAFREANLASTTAVVLMFLSACCSQLVVSSCGGMMGAMRRERPKRVAGSFYQGGSLAFGRCV